MKKKRKAIGALTCILSDKCLDCPHGSIEWITSDSSSVFIIIENNSPVDLSDTGGQANLILSYIYAAAITKLKA